MRPSPLRLGEAERDRLTTGAAALGIELDPAASARLAGFADALDVWNAKTNLISCGSATELVDRHILDALALDPLLPDEGAIADLGSGAGFPGLPIAVVRPDQHILLIESRRRKANFLREVKRLLRLGNVEVREQRAEAAPEPSERVLAVVSRAVWSDASLTMLAPSWLKTGGRLFWMRADHSDPTNERGSSCELSWERRMSYSIGAGPRRVVDIFLRT